MINFYLSISYCFGQKSRQKQDNLGSMRSKV